jgi:hypothetical protein
MLGKYDVGQTTLSVQWSSGVRICVYSVGSAVRESSCTEGHNVSLHGAKQRLDP